MNTLKHISAIISIVAILGLSGCFWGRGGWGGGHSNHEGAHHEGDRGSEHYSR